MATLRTICPECGAVDMGPESVVLLIDPVTAWTYRFVCPRCLASVEKYADRTIAARLLSAGVGVRERANGSHGNGHLPVAEDPWLGGPGMHITEDANSPEPAEPIGPRRLGLPPFTLDDVIGLHFLLQDERFLRKLATDTQ